jgi:hypothetical protein
MGPGKDPNASPSLQAISQKVQLQETGALGLNINILIIHDNCTLVAKYNAALCLLVSPNIIPYTAINKYPATY